MELVWCVGRRKCDRFFVLETRGIIADNAYISTSSSLYVRTLRCWIDDPTSTVIEDAIRNVVANGPDEDPGLNFRAETRSFVLPLNLSGNHWTFAHICKPVEGPKTIRVYDSLRPRCSITRRQLHHLAQFVELIGQYYPNFMGTWHGTIAYGQTVTQTTSDCGPIAAWGMRTILTGSTLDPECDNPIEFKKASDHSA
jgi:hypothetical protein